MDVFLSETHIFRQLSMPPSTDPTPPPITQFDVINPGNDVIDAKKFAVLCICYCFSHTSWFIIHYVNTGSRSGSHMTNEDYRGLVALTTESGTDLPEIQQVVSGITPV